MRRYALILIVMGCLIASALAAAGEARKVQDNSFLLEEALRAYVRRGLGI